MWSLNILTSSLTRHLKTTNKIKHAKILREMKLRKSLSIKKNEKIVIMIQRLKKLHVQKQARIKNRFSFILLCRLPRTTYSF